MLGPDGGGFGPRRRGALLGGVGVISNDGDVVVGGADGGANGGAGGAGDAGDSADGAGGAGDGAGGAGVGGVGGGPNPIC